MSKKEKSGGKKFAAFLGLLLLAGIVVVVVLLVLPANSSTISQSLQQNIETSFLENQSEQEKFSSFRTKLSSNNISYYSQEIGDIYILSSTFNTIIDYYNQYFIFAENNNTLNSNAKIIKKGLAEIKSNQEQLNKILDDALLLNNKATSYLKNAMIDFRITYVKMLDGYKSTVKALNNCYSGCFEVSFTNNKASKRILNTVDDFISVINDDFKILISIDSKDSTAQGNYNYISKGKIEKFSEFVNRYLSRTNNGEILKYTVNGDLQVKYDKINNFFPVYGEGNLCAVINSINSSGVITKTYEIEDEQNLYDEVKTFILG